MDNNVVLALRDAFVEAGYSSLRFNFRGTGRSDGIYGDGNGEVEDLMEIVEFCRKEKYSRIVVSGYSFGAWIVIKASSCISPVPAMVLVSPPVAMYDFEKLTMPPGSRCLVISGTDDHICPIDDLNRWCGNLPCLVTLVEVQGSDHFYTGKENDIFQAVTKFLRSLGSVANDQ